MQVRVLRERDQAFPHNLASVVDPSDATSKRCEEWEPPFLVLGRLEIDVISPPSLWGRIAILLSSHPTSFLLL